MSDGHVSCQDQELIRTLCGAIGARQGLVWVYTAEEIRALKLVQCAAKSTKRGLLFWRCTTGLHDVKGRAFEGTVMPIDAFNFVLREDGDYAYVFLDLPSHMIAHPGTQTMVVIRKLKDVAMALSRRRSTLFVVTSNPTPPKEVADLVYRMDLPLPDVETIKVNVLQELERRNFLALNAKGLDLFAEGLLGATLQKAEDILAREINKHRKLTIASLSAVSKARAELVEGVAGLQFILLDGGLASLGGMLRFKQWLQERKAAFTEQGRKAGLEPPRGVLFVGPPGVGKSLAAKLSAEMLGLILLRLDMGAVFNKYVGESEANVRRLQSVVDAFSRAELWLDEIEKGMPGSSGETDGGTSSRVLGDLLTWGQERKGKVFFVATANNVAALRPEILRPGRFFDGIFFMDLPTPEERKEIFRIHLSKRNRKVKDFDLEILAKNSEGYTGAEMEEAIRSGLYIAFGERKALETKHILKALQRIQPISKVMAEDIERIRRWARGRARPAGGEGNYEACA